MKKTILLKISGESFKKNNESIDITKLINIAKQIKVLAKKYNIAIVIGGGNILRGGTFCSKNCSRVVSDQMGMLATVINSLALSDVLKHQGIENELYSSISMPSIAKIYNVRSMLKNLREKNKVIILSAGTGSPFFSTDTGIALRALEMQADMILMGKNGVDGVYSSDPNKNPSAKRFEKITYTDAINKDLKIIDMTAMSLLKDSNINIVIFNINQENAFIKVLANTIPYTTVYNKGNK